MYTIRTTVYNIKIKIANTFTEHVQPHKASNKYFKKIGVFLFLKVVIFSVCNHVMK